MTWVGHLFSSVNTLEESCPCAPGDRDRDAPMSSVRAEDRKLPKWAPSVAQMATWWSGQWPCPHKGTMRCRERKGLFHGRGTALRLVRGHYSAVTILVPIHWQAYVCSLPPRPPFYRTFFFTAKLKTLYRDHPDTHHLISTTNTSTILALPRFCPCVCLPIFRSGVCQGKLQNVIASPYILSMHLSAGALHLLAMFVF